MNKADLVAAMAEKAGVSKKDAEASLKAVSYTHLDVYKRQQHVHSSAHQSSYGRRDILFMQQPRRQRHVQYRC